MIRRPGADSVVVMAANTRQHAIRLWPKSVIIERPYCELFHTAMAKMNGATQEELSEIYFLASFTARWSAIIHAQHYDYNTFANELQQIGAYLQKK